MKNQPEYAQYFTTTALERLQSYIESLTLECKKFNIAQTIQDQIISDFSNYLVNIGSDYRDPLTEANLGAVLKDIGEPLEVLYSHNLLIKCRNCSLFNSLFESKCINCDTATTESQPLDIITIFLNGTPLKGMYYTILSNKLLQLVTAVLLSLIFVAGMVEASFWTGFLFGGYFLLLSMRHPDNRTKLDAIWGFFRLQLLKAFVLLIFSLSLFTDILIPEYPRIKSFDSPLLFFGLLLMFTLSFWIFLPEQFNSQYFRFLYKQQQLSSTFNRHLYFEVGFFIVICVIYLLSGIIISFLPTFLANLEVLQPTSFIVALSSLLFIDSMVHFILLRTYIFKQRDTSKTALVLMR